jgi:ATP-dependent Clp protease adaptor protein ClpS
VSATVGEPLSRPGGQPASTSVEAPLSRTVEEPRTVGPGDALGGHWNVIVRNDDHNTFDHVARTLARVIPGVTLQRGYDFAERIHHRGLAIVWSGHREAAEHYWEMLSSAGLTMAPLERC